MYTSIKPSRWRKFHPSEMKGPPYFSIWDGVNIKIEIINIRMFIISTFIGESGYYGLSGFHWRLKNFKQSAICRGRNESIRNLYG